MTTARDQVEIVNERGLHARASAKFVKLASSFDSEIKVTREGQTVPVDMRTLLRGEDNFELLAGDTLELQR